MLEKKFWILKSFCTVRAAIQGLSLLQSVFDAVFFSLEEMRKLGF